MGLEKVRKWMKVNNGPTPLPDEEWYFLKYIIENNLLLFDFSQESKEKIMKLILEDTISWVNKLNEEGINPLLTKSLLSQLDINFTTQDIIYINKNPFSIIIRFDKKDLLIISKNKKNAYKTCNGIKKHFMKYSGNIKEYGYTLDYFISGKKIVEDWLIRNGSISEIKEFAPKNKLEQKVIKYIENFTDSFLSNIEIIFNDPKESFEYDIILVLPQLFLNIEIKDYISVKNEIQKISKNINIFKENIKSNILLKNIDKANKLGLKTIIILNGFPKDIFINIKKIADSRGINLFNANSLNDFSNFLMKQISKKLNSKKKHARK